MSNLRSEILPKEDGKVYPFLVRFWYGSGKAESFFSDAKTMEDLLEVTKDAFVPHMICERVADGSYSPVWIRGAFGIIGRDSPKFNTMREAFSASDPTSGVVVVHYE